MNDDRRWMVQPGACGICDDGRREIEQRRLRGVERPEIVMMPWHDASENCESGKHEHCTCDTCF